MLPLKLGEIYIFDRMLFDLEEIPKVDLVVDKMEFIIYDLLFYLKNTLC